MSVRRHWAYLRYVLRHKVCDWRGASMAQGYGDDVLPWYKKNKGKMVLARKTREAVDILVLE